MTEDIYTSFEKGYEAVSTTIDSVLKDIDWRYFSIVLYEEQPIFWEERVLVPEQFLISLADKFRSSEIPTVLLLNGSRNTSYSALNCSTCYRKLLSTIGLDKFTFVFSGGLTDLKAKLRYPDVKLSLQNVLDFDTLSDALKNTAPVPRKIDLEKFNEIRELIGLSEFLIDYLRPPSLTEELIQQLESTSQYELASHVISSLSVALNPASAVTKGLSYALKFAEMVQKRKSETYQAFLNNWQLNVENAFSPSSLVEMIGESNINELKSVLHESNVVIVITDVFENLQSIFIPALVKSLLADEEEIILLMDSITRLDRFKGFQDWLVGVTDTEKIKLASVVPTYGIFSEWFDAFFLKLIQDRVFYFNVNSRFLDKILQGRPISEEAWIIKHFREVRKSLEKKQVAFISFDSKEEFPLSFVKPSLTARVVHGVKWKFRRFKRRLLSKEDFTTEKENREEESEKGSLPEKSL